MENWLLRAETICLECGGHCCNEAHPPVSSARYAQLTNAGVSPEMFESVGYKRIKTKENGECILSENGKCRIHSCKPETCRSGPFTFDMNGDMIVIYLKHEQICPVVGLLKEVPDAYRQQYELAVRNITHLVKDLTDDELLKICIIDEPETEKVAEVPRQDKHSL